MTDTPRADAYDALWRESGLDGVAPTELLRFLERELIAARKELGLNEQLAQDAIRMARALAFCGPRRMNADLRRLVRKYLPGLDDY